MRGRFGAVFTCVLAGAMVAAGCAARKPAPATPSPLPTFTMPTPRVAETPVPTVPPATPAPIPTRPVPNPNVKATKGKPIGPIITHFGAAKADGHSYEPESVAKDGTATYRNRVGSGFMIVVETKPGLSNTEVGHSIYAHDPKDPSRRPDLQLISNRPLGDGSKEVCDRRMPNIGGIPAAPSFKETQEISDTLNDMGCRFETFLESSGACTVTPNGDFSFVSKETTSQFCMVVAKAWALPIGTTELTVRVRDVEGNPGPAKKIKIVYPGPQPRPKRKPGPRPKTTPKPRLLPTR